MTINVHHFTVYIQHIHNVQCISYAGPCEPVFEEPQPQSAVPMANENDVDSVPESPQRGSEDGNLI